MPSQVVAHALACAQTPSVEVDTGTDLNLHAASIESGVKYGTLRVWSRLDPSKGPLRTTVRHGHTTTTIASIEAFAREHAGLPAVVKFEADRVARAGVAADQTVLAEMARTLGNEPLVTDLQRETIRAVVRRIGSAAPLSDSEVGLHRDLLTALGVFRPEGERAG